MSCGGTQRIAHDSQLASRLWSEYHRDRLCQYIPKLVAYCCGLIDIDSVETCRNCGAAVALIETKHERENARKWKCTDQVARDAGIPAYLVVVHGEEPPLAFTVVATDGSERYLDESGMAVWLFKLRERHCGYCRDQQLRQAFVEFHTPGAAA